MNKKVTVSVVLHYPDGSIVEFQMGEKLFFRVSRMLLRDTWKRVIRKRGRVRPTNGPALREEQPDTR